MAGRVPNGQWFQLAPAGSGRCAQTAATVGGPALGEPGPLPQQAHLADIWLPQRGLVAVGFVRMEALDPDRHLAAGVRTDDRDAAGRATDPAAARTRGSRAGPRPPAGPRGSRTVVPARSAVLDGLRAGLRGRGALVRARGHAGHGRRGCRRRGDRVLPPQPVPARVRAVVPRVRPRRPREGVRVRGRALLSEHLFATRRVGRLQLVIHPANVASQRVAERAGYGLDGVLRAAWFRHGTFHDVQVWSRVGPLVHPHHPNEPKGTS